MPKEKSAEVNSLLKELDQKRSFETYAGYLAYRKSMADLAALVPVSLNNWPVTPEEAWQANPIEDEDLWNPVAAVSQIKIPILAIFGDKDRNMDSLQAALAYQKALGEAGNPKSQVEVFPNADHIILTSKTGCQDELQKTISRFFLSFAITHVLTSQEKIMTYISDDPYKPGLLTSIPYAPGYLDLMEGWLKSLYSDEQ
jgi:pimeloyl-ACP methyl ester carboxylesterase